MKLKQIPNNAIFIFQSKIIYLTTLWLIAVQLEWRKYSIMCFILWLLPKIKYFCSVTESPTWRLWISKKIFYFLDTWKPWWGPSLNAKQWHNDHEMIEFSTRLSANPKEFFFWHNLRITRNVEKVKLKNRNRNYVIDCSLHIANEGKSASQPVNQFSLIHWFWFLCHVFWQLFCIISLFFVVFIPCARSKRANETCE